MAKLSSINKKLIRKWTHEERVDAVEGIQRTLNQLQSVIRRYKNQHRILFKNQKAIQEVIDEEV